MQRKIIEFQDLSVKIHHLWGEQWVLLTAGDFESGQYNCMTVAWGSLGTMWGKPMAQVVVRPSRHTFQFMEKYDSFTLCAFEQKYRPALQLLGSKSGRDGDKISETSLKPMASTQVTSPCFEQAELVLECKKMYWQDMDKTHFLNDDIEGNYGGSDYHRIYFGEVVAVQRREYVLDGAHAKSRADQQAEASHHQTVKMRCPNCGKKVRGKPERFIDPYDCPMCGKMGIFIKAEDE